MNYFSCFWILRFRDEKENIEHFLYNSSDLQTNLRDCDRICHSFVIWSSPKKEEITWISTNLENNSLMKRNVGTILSLLYGPMAAIAHIVNATDHICSKAIPSDLAPMNVHDVNDNLLLRPKRRCTAQNCRFGLGCKPYITSSIRVRAFHQ